jgi:hypothetical protein
VAATPSVVATSINRNSAKVEDALGSMFQAATPSVMTPSASRMMRSAPAAARRRKMRLMPSVVSAVSRLPTSIAGGMFFLLW